MLLHKVAWRGAPVSRCPVQEGSSLGVLLRRATCRAAWVGRRVRGRLALFQWGFLLLREGDGRRGGEGGGGKAGVTGSRSVLSARAV